MTCAACAGRVERSLNRLEGVEATVNYATERASVRFDAKLVAPGAIVAAVEDGGLRAPGCRRAGRRRPIRPRAAAAARRRRRAVGARARARDDPGAAVRLLAVGLARARDAGRAVGGRAVPPRRLAEPPPPRRDDGHARLARHAGRVGVVGRGPLLPRRGCGRHADAVRAHHVARRRERLDLPRGRLRRHHVHPRRPLLRGARQAALRSRAAGAARARRQGRRGARRGRRRAAHPDRRAGASATASSCGRARRSRATASSRRAPPRVDQALLTGESIPVEKAPGDERHGRDGQRWAAGWSCAPSPSAPTPHWRRSAAS